jgi:hypothetical protein
MRCAEVAFVRNRTEICHRFRYCPFPASAMCLLTGALGKDVISMDRTQRDAGATVPRRNEPHESAWQGNARRSWDPHDVWLTRVRQPRELAERLVADVSVPQSSRKIPE